jgi:DNA-binding transcriptional LysR family regulator
MFSHRTYDPLFIDRWVCVGWTGAWPADTVIDLPRFLAARHIVPDQPQSIRQDFDEVHIDRDVAAVVPYALLLRSLVGTPWLATVPEKFVTQNPWRDTLQMFPLPFAVHPVEIVQQWHPEATNDASILWLRTTVREALARAGIETLPLSPKNDERDQNS